MQTGGDIRGLVLLLGMVALFGHGLMRTVDVVIE